jgi:diguanylate cyclase (GGDEF)-like protein
MLIGDIGKVFLDAGRVDEYPCEVQANILDGIAAAARGAFGAVGIVMDGTSSQLGAALRALGKSTRAKIILLAQMHEEPIARRLAAKGRGEERLAHSYLICPTCLASFLAHAAGRRPGDTGRGTKDGARKRADGAASSVRSFLSLPLDVEQRIRHLERLATTDDLTGLKNRRYLWQFARQILEHAAAGNGRVTLLVFDIDNFKHYNDVYGHAAGDEILRQAAVLIRRCCRPHDVVGRIGGDEFAVIFWDDPYRSTGAVERDRRSAVREHPTEAISVARRFRKDFGDADLHLLGPEGRGVLTISGGLASFPRDGSTVEELFERADLALLDAKRGGKNRIYLVGEPQNDITEGE